MIFRLRTAISVAALLVVVSSTAFAQFETSDRSRIGLRMSDFRPSNSVLSSMTGNWLTPTLDVNLRFDELDRPTHVLSFSLFGQESGGRRAKYMPITYNYIKHFSKNQETRSGWYAGAGLGIYQCKFESSYYGGWTDSSSTNIGLSFTAGYDLNEAWYGELKYDMAGGVADPVAGDVHFEGLTLSFGTRIAL